MEETEGEMMSNFEKAIKIIMAEPPEARYPSYYASLLRKADVPDKNVGECSEIPTGSDLISRQQAIKAIEHRLAEPAYLHIGEDWYVGMNCAESELYDLPPAEPETSILTVTVAPDSKEIERIARKIKDTPVMVLPSAQPERKKGHWVRNDNGTYSCSVCQSWIPEEQHYYARYCLYCGADMRGEQDG